MPGSDRANADSKPVGRLLQPVSLKQERLALMDGDDVDALSPAAMDA